MSTLTNTQKTRALFEKMSGMCADGPKGKGLEPLPFAPHFYKRLPFWLACIIIIIYKSLQVAPGAKL